MSSDDSSALRLRAGKIGDRGNAASRRPRSFVAQVMKAVTKAKGAGIAPASTLRDGRDGGTARSRGGARMRRVVVKARIVRLRLGSKGADAHLRYLQRDGTDREGERGRLYGSESEVVDGREFLERGRDDRHQFRFIVAPEDGDRLSDLRGFTRDVMRQMEEDFGTKLDWVAVDHFNTGHPHSHMVIRGKDDAGKDLIIAQDYITDGIRLRAQERATLELGPETDLELRTKLNRALTARSHERALESYSLHGEEPKGTIIGRVIDKRLTDELGERLGLVIDGMDGRVHHVALGSDPMATAADGATIGSIVEIGPTPTGPRAADRNIARIVGDTGDYCPSVHRAMAEAGGVRVPGGDYGAYVESHVRRLEALRRAGIVERIEADHWRIPENFETRAAEYDAQRRGRPTFRLLSNLDLEAQIDANGATWLDRELVSPDRTSLVSVGFGSEVDVAMQRRKEALVDKGHAWRTPDGAIRAPKDLVARLERQEIERVGKSLEGKKRIPFRMASEGESVSGVFAGTTNLVSGKYAVIENAYEFTLVPWRPIMDERLGRQISGVVRSSGITWDFARTRALGIGM